MDKIRINLYELLLCLSNAQDLVSHDLSNHHQQVAYLSFRLAEQLRFPTNQQKSIFLAALVHDIGALSVDEKLEIIDTESLNINNHAFKGAKLLEKFKPLQEETNYIRYHHLPWNNGEGLKYKGNDVPFASHVIHLADRVCVKIDLSKNILSQLPEILSAIIKDKNTLFSPILVDALIELSKKEYIWLDLISNSPVDKLSKDSFEVLVLEIDDIVDLTSVFSQIIDFRSEFTALHSAGVAVTARKIAELVGFSPLECKMMLIAGYLHDLGKLAIDNDVLEKPSKLNDDEFNEIRSHTYYTYQLLDNIKEFKTINTWASFHHERLDGNGYPFHIKGDNLSLGSRIMAVADVFTAITENRPYRNGMTYESTIDVLNNMVKNGGIDGKIVGLLADNFNDINDIRKDAQAKVFEQYNKILETK